MLQPRLVDVGEVVDGLAPMLRRLIEANIELVVRLTPDLPPLLFDRGQRSPARQTPPTPRPRHRRHRRR